MERKEEIEAITDLYACRFCCEKYKRFSQLEKHMNFCYNPTKTALSKRVVLLIEKNKKDNNKILINYFTEEEKEWIRFINF